MLRQRGGRRRVAFLLSAAIATIGCSDATERPPLGRALGQIVGGYVDSLTRGAVGLGYDAGGSFFGQVCSGTLISPNVVLTATHCVTYNGSFDAGVDCSTTTFGSAIYAPYVLVSPETTFPSSDTSPSLYRAREIRSAPGPGLTCGYDVSLVLLQGAGIPPASATPIEPRLDDMPAAGELFDAIGYGITSPSDTTGQTAGTRMRIDDRGVICRGSECGSTWQNYLATDEWLGDAPVCSGDSGGPALDGQGRVEGVASRGGNGCTYIIYGGLAAWKSFIVGTVIDAAQVAGFSPPSWTGFVAVDSGSDAAKPDSGGLDAAASDVTAPDAGASRDAGSSAGSDSAAEASLRLPGQGESCTNTCAADLACVSESGQPPGVCVPLCGAGKPPCPSSLTCSTHLGVCLTKAASAAPSSDGGCGCVIRRPDGASGILSIVTLLFAAGSRRFLRRRPPALES